MNASARGVDLTAADLIRHLDAAGIRHAAVLAAAPDLDIQVARDTGEAFRALPLTEAEFQVIAGNIAPYLR